MSALLYVVYTVSVGGDFMSGRFFAMPFLVAVIALIPQFVRRESSAAAIGSTVALQPAEPLSRSRSAGAYEAGMAVALAERDQGRARALISASPTFSSTVPSAALRTTRGCARG